MSIDIMPSNTAFMDIDTQHDARILYEYLSSPGHQTPTTNSDCLLVFGCNDLSVASHAASLWHQGIAAKIIFSGGFGRYTQFEFQEPEATVFARLAIALGVNPSAIMTEAESRNTQENIEQSLKLLYQEHDAIVHLTLITKPILCRRVEATFSKLSSLPYTMSVDHRDELSKHATLQEQVIHQVVGEISRLQYYPALGYCNITLIPDYILASQHRLITRGYTQQVVKSLSKS